MGKGKAGYYYDDDYYYGKKGKGKGKAGYYYDDYYRRDLESEEFNNNISPISDEIVDENEVDVIDRDLGKKVYYYDDDYYYGKKGKGKGKGKGKAGYYYDDYYYR